jgi:hypothetical protein
MSDDFTSASAPSGGIAWDEHNGKLLIVEPLSYETGIQTVHGEKDAVRANVYVLTGPTTSDDFEDTLVFPGVLVGQLKRQIGSKIVGRLTQGAKKPGQNAPWLLDAATAEDIDKARTWQLHRQAAPLVSASAAPAGGQAEAQPPF